jgi:hypothetical protein
MTQPGRKDVTTLEAARQIVFAIEISGKTLNKVTGRVETSRDNRRERVIKTQLTSTILYEGFCVAAVGASGLFEALGTLNFDAPAPALAAAALGASPFWGPVDGAGGGLTPSTT